MQAESIETILEDGKRKWALFSEPFNSPPNKREGNSAEARRIVAVIREMALPFPLTYYFMKEESVRAGFENLKAYVGDWVPKTHDVIKGHSGKWWLPSLFRGKPRQFITKPMDWWRIDVIVDWFTEYERISAKKEYAPSPNESWQDDKVLTKVVLTCSKKENLDCASLRDAVYYAGRELGLFRCTRAKSLLEEILGGDLKGRRWLDMSAGWGDRLMTACALEMNYVAFDPNRNLEHGHSKMIAMFGSGRQRVHYHAFQTDDTAKLLEMDVRERGAFDISLISPPFYIIERYRGDGQSTETYPELDDWIVKFLFKSLSTIWRFLKDGGYLAINMGNIRDCDITGPMQLFIEDFLPGCHWEGMLTFSNKGVQEVPGITYVWRKSGEDRKQLWNPKIVRSLKLLFPKLHSLWLNESDFIINSTQPPKEIDEKKAGQNEPN